MARKVNKNTITGKRKEQIQAATKFYKRLLTTFLTTVVLCAAALGYLYFWLYRYEKQSINGAMTQYVQDVENHKWDKIYHTDTRYFTELNSKEAITSYLLYVYDNVKAGGATFAYMGGDEQWKYYDVYYRQQKVSTLEVYKPENSSTWKVRTYVTGGEYTFDVLNNVPFRINGTPITSEYNEETDQKPAGFLDLGVDDLLPNTTRYTVQNLVTPPDPIPEDSEHNMCVRDYSGNRYYVGPKPTAEQYSDFANEIEATAMAYCKYTTKDGTYNELTRHLLTGTEFYKNISSFDNQYFSSHDSIDFQNVVISDVMPLGENAFIGNISFDFLVSASDASRSYSATYQMYFIRTSSGAWKATNIYIISSEENAS